MAEANHCARLIWTAAFSFYGHWQKEEGIIIIMERERETVAPRRIDETR